MTIPIMATTMIENSTPTTIPVVIPALSEEDSADGPGFRSLEAVLVVTLSPGGHPA